jgi:ureidoacrylate peracid hydrolase
MELGRRDAIGALAAGALMLAARAPLSAATAAAPHFPPLETSLKPEESALLIVDVQNSFAAPGGEHYKQLEKMYADTGFIPNAVSAVKQARRKGIQVIQVMEAYTPDYRELDFGNAASFHRSQIARQSWKAGTQEVQLLDAMQPGPGDRDMLYPNRTTASGFGSNGLDQMLRSRGIRNVAVGGFVTEVCVYATVLAGYDLGYRMYALSDLTANFHDQLGAMMWTGIMPYWSRTMTSKDYLGMFS